MSERNNLLREDLLFSHRTAPIGMCLLGLRRNSYLGLHLTVGGRCAPRREVLSITTHYEQLSSEAPAARFSGHFVFASFVSAFLLKLLRPEFSNLVMREQTSQIFGLIGKLIQVLASSEVSIDDRHTPRLGSLSEDQIPDPEASGGPGQMGAGGGPSQSVFHVSAAGLAARRQHVTAGAHGRAAWRRRRRRAGARCTPGGRGRAAEPAVDVGRVDGHTDL
ncbi:hypothetical protein DFH11DRAFT_1881133 [Phellopilus nigrolimitatus]|nr:hypothetical protein DFH11DRAFT_1881133 [Phellopilus nigrolimitatus]